MRGLLLLRLVLLLRHLSHVRAQSVDECKTNIAGGNCGPCDDHLTEEEKERELKSRPWFCGRLPEDTYWRQQCLGPGQTHNRTVTGLCQGRWQWYQLWTVHDHDVPYYEVMTYADGWQQNKQSTETTLQERGGVNTGRFKN